MTARIVRLSDIRIAPASSIEDWRIATSLVTELVDWMSNELSFDARSGQENSREELADMASFYAFPDGLFLLGRIDGEVAGCAGIRLLDDDTAELKRVWVRPEARGRGLAQVLLARAIDSARALGAQRVILETEPRAMAKAVRMYRETGFREAAPFSNLVERVPTVLTMEKRVA